MHTLPVASSHPFILQPTSVVVLTQAVFYAINGSILSRNSTGNAKSISHLWKENLQTLHFNHALALRYKGNVVIWKEIQKAVSLISIINARYWNSSFWALLK